MPEAVWEVLLVDDADPMRRLCATVLEETDHEISITTASSGEEALELLRQRRFDAVLTDYRMGAINGLHVLTEARRAQPDAMRFLMTGHPTAQLEAAAREKAEVLGFIDKGSGGSGFVQRLEDVARSWRGAPTAV